MDHNAFGPSGMAYLAPAVMSLTDLSLVGNEIGDAGADVLFTHLKGLTSLNAARNSITEKGARTLMALPHLRTLSLHRNKGVAASVAPGLQGNTTLTQLDLSHTGMDDGQLGAFVASLRQNVTLVSLNVAANMITAAGGHHLSGFLKGSTPLVELDVSNNNLQSAGARGILSHAPQPSVAVSASPSDSTALLTDVDAYGEADASRHKLLLENILAHSTPANAAAAGAAPRDDEAHFRRMAAESLAKKAALEAEVV